MLFSVIMLPLTILMVDIRENQNIA